MTLKKTFACSILTLTVPLVEAQNQMSSCKRSPQIWTLDDLTEDILEVA